MYGWKFNFDSLAKLKSAKPHYDCFEMMTFFTHIINEFLCIITKQDRTVVNTSNTLHVDKINNTRNGI